MLLWQFPSSMTKITQSPRASPDSELHSKAHLESPQTAWPLSYCYRVKLLKLSSLAQGMEHFIQGYTSCLGTTVIPPRNPKALAPSPALPALLLSLFAGHWPSGTTCHSSASSPSPQPLDTPLLEPRRLKLPFAELVMFCADDTNCLFHFNRKRVRQKLQVFKICRNSY